MDSEPEHYRLSPSSSSRWLVCPGSARDDLPDTPTPKSKAGDAAHEEVDDGLKHDTMSAIISDNVYARVCEILDPDSASAIADVAFDYVEYVRSLGSDREHEIKIKHPEIIDFGGTVDTLVDETPLHIVDLKSGTWKVPAKNSTQLRCYAILAGHHQYGEVVDAKGTIIQSRVYAKPNSFFFPADELKQLEDKIHWASTSDDIVAGDHCYFCPLRPVCPERARVYPNWD